MRHAAPELRAMPRTEQPHIFHAQALLGPALPADSQESWVDRAAEHWQDIVAQRERRLQALLQLSGAGLRHQTSWGLLAFMLGGDVLWESRVLGMPRRPAAQLDALVTNFVDEV